MILAAIQQAHVVVDKALTIKDSGWIIFAALASSAVAATTLILALYTRASVKATLRIIQNENRNFRISTTLAVIREFYEPVAMSSLFAASPQIGMARLAYFYSLLRKQREENPQGDPAQQRLAVVTAAIKLYPGAGETPPPDNIGGYVRNAFQFSCGAFASYFSKAWRLLERDALDRDLFMSNFAQRFPRALKMLDFAQAELACFDDAEPMLEELREFATACEQWTLGNGEPVSG